MNNTQRRAIEMAASDRRYGITQEKGPEYSQAGTGYGARDADTLANFKKVGERLGQTPVTVLMVYFLKHIDSITTTVREAEEPGDGSRHLRYARGEGIRGRLDDARNYLDLLECLLVDTGGLEDVSPYTVLYEQSQASVEELESRPRTDPTALARQWLEEAGDIKKPGPVHHTARKALREQLDNRPPLAIEEEPTRTSVGADEARLTPELTIHRGELNAAFHDPRWLDPSIKLERKDLLPTRLGTPEIGELPGPAKDGTGTGFASGPVRDPNYGETGEL